MTNRDLFSTTNASDAEEDSALVRESETRISAARVLLLRDAPFFGALAMRLRPQPGHTSSGTMGVTATARLVYSPAFVLSLPLKQLAGCLAHEVLHLAGDIFGRRGTRDPYLTNIAHDYAINPLVLQSGLALPDGVLLDEKFKDMAAEDIYEVLRREEERKGRSRSHGSGRNRKNPLGVGAGVGCADHDDPENRAYAEGRAGGDVMTPEDWRAAVAEAAEYARGRGQLPAGLERFVGALFEPKLDWRAVLARTTGRAINQAETSWRVPSRRSWGAGARLPGWARLGMDATLALDTSGSIGEAELRLFASEAEEIMRLAGAALTVYCADAGVASEIDARSIAEVSVRGGGGTDFAPVFRRINERLDRPCRLLVYFTDLDGQFPADAPRYPVVWCLPSALRGRCKQPPFGTILFIPQQSEA
jgi:predicted metal-dependent peptidase